MHTGVHGHSSVHAFWHTVLQNNTCNAYPYDTRCILMLFVRCQTDFSNYSKFKTYQLKNTALWYVLTTLPGRVFDVTSENWRTC